MPALIRLTCINRPVSVARIFMPAFGLIGLNWAYGFDDTYAATQKKRVAIPLYHRSADQVYYELV